MIRQGELLFRVVKDIPSDAVRSLPVEGLIVVGHSETGHYHAVRDIFSTEFFETPNPHICYLRTTELPAEVEHFRFEHQHGLVHLKPFTVYEVRRQTQFLHRNEPRVWLD